ncbi:MAG: LLM class flavin-dependent oxidoreductase, partial [Actinomycetota bacterium]|nr:LLM class flavin-dependent oxidoreductase [Actinomycetota bacterium]
MASVMLGLNVATSVSPGDDPVRVARRAEEAGFDFVSSNDHPCGRSPNYETWTLLSWIAASTSRVRIASRVLGVPYRSPPMLAKMAESLNRLSGGRLILGLGGGYSDDEFRAFGLKVPTPKEKIKGLEEAIEITRGLWSERSFTYTGQHYRTRAADIEPKPHTHIPIWLGTFRPRALALTGRLADGWIPSLSEDAPPEGIHAMQDIMFKAAEEAGRDRSEITCAYNVRVQLGSNARDPYLVSGSPQQVTERLREFVE